MPVHVIRLYEDRTLNAEEMMLLSKIDALQDPKRGGCFASNGYLSDWWKKSHTWVSKSISRFEKLGLVKTQKKNRGNRLIVSLLAIEQNFKGPLNKSSRGLEQKFNGNLAIERSKEREGTPAASGRLLPGLPSPVTKYSKAVMRFARFSRSHDMHLNPYHKTGFKRGANEHGWTRATLLQWQDAWRILRRRVKPDVILETVKWYEKNYGGEFVPEAHTFRTFAERFDKIRRAMTRQRKDREQDRERNGFTSDDEMKEILRDMSPEERKRYEALPIIKSKK